MSLLRVVMSVCGVKYVSIVVIYVCGVKSCLYRE